MDPESGDGPPRALLIAAVVVAVGALAAVLVVAALRQGAPEERPVAIVTVPAPRADSAECRTLVDALPDELGNYHRAAAADPAPLGTAAWRAPAGDEAIILRCGLDRPAEFVVGAPIQVVDSVQWFRIADNERSTWYAVDRPVYVALTLPAGTGPTPIQEISQTIAKTLSTNDVDPGPVN